METDWAAKAMRGELGDAGPEARITWEALGAVYRSEPAPSRYGRDPAGDFSEAEPIVVTEEMLAAVEALCICVGRDPYKTAGDMWTAIYRAMAAVAPSSNLADRHAQQKKTICELLGDRDAALARAEAAERRNSHWERTANDLKDLGWVWKDRALTAEQRLAALEPKPEPAHDPFREFPSDRRRVGG